MPASDDPHPKLLRPSSRRFIRRIAFREHILVMTPGERLCVLAAIRQRPSARDVIASSLFSRPVTPTRVREDAPVLG